MNDIESHRASLPQGGASGRRMQLAFVYAQGRLQRLDSVRAGRSASEFFYGSEELRALGHEVGLFEVARDASPGWPARAVDYLFSKGLLPNRTRGWVLLGARRLLRELNRYDVVVATSTGLAFSLGIWKTLGLLRPQIAAIHCGIFNYHPNALRRRQISFLLRRMWSVVFGEAECPPMRTEFGIEPERMRVNSFGVDTRFWAPAELPRDEGYLLAVGNDSRRDYDLLVRVAAQHPWRVILVTRLPVATPIPPNVEIRAGSWHREALTDLELRELYRGASCVVVPLLDSLQPSGQSVTLQAMACGKPVVLTRTRGLWAPAAMRDGDNVVFTAPGDPDGLARAVEGLLRDPAARERIGRSARRTVEGQFTIDLFAARMDDLCRAALAEARPAPPAHAKESPA